MKLITFEGKYAFLKNEIFCLCLLFVVVKSLFTTPNKKSGLDFPFFIYFSAYIFE